LKRIDATLKYMTKQHTILAIVSLFAIIIGGLVLYKKNSENKEIVLFACKDSKTIKATFYPLKDTSVDITVSDGRSFVLTHATSASGARYINADESIVFWNKGLTAFMTEGKVTTYADCMTQKDVTVDVQATTTQGKPSTQVATVNSPSFKNGYASSEYGFSMRFPSYVTSQNFFTTFYILASNWRLNASQANQGKAVVSFPIYRIDQGSVSTEKTSYPLNFTAEVRVGVSPNVKECYATDPGYTNQKVTNVTINGISFKRFSFADAAMMKYVQGESYRTIHNNMCYVLEQIKSGSSYKDEKMKTGVSEATLDGYYKVGEQIIKTFKFTR
jgi:membrane-bound inhibitor of C-type lysozyme